MEDMLISDGIYNLIIFVLAIYVGYHVVWNVTPAPVSYTHLTLPTTERV